jgi:hypothetical protein
MNSAYRFKWIKLGKKSEFSIQNYTKDLHEVFINGTIRRNKTLKI